MAEALALALATVNNEIYVSEGAEHICSTNVLCGNDTKQHKQGEGRCQYA